jgi:hypothetical protein
MNTLQRTYLRIITEADREVLSTNKEAGTVTIRLNTTAIGGDYLGITLPDYFAENKAVQDYTFYNLVKEWS